MNTRRQSLTIAPLSDDDPVAPGGRSYDHVLRSFVRPLRSLRLCAFALILLAACLPTPEPLPTLLVVPTAPPTDTPVPPPPTDPPAPTVALTPTLTPTLTATPEPLPSYEILYQVDGQPMVVASDGSNPRSIDLDLADENMMYSISPDGHYLAYYRGGVVYTYDIPAGGPPEEFTTAAYVKSLAWKPDSLTLLFSIYPRGGREMGGGVWSYGFTDIDPINLVNATEAMGDWGRFVFSPDGHWAAFCTKPEAPGHYCGQLYVLEIGLRLAHLVPIDELCDPFQLVWSPDSTRFLVACSSDFGIGSKIFSVNASSREPKQLTPERWSDVTPAWSPDGKRIVFRTRLDTTEIWIMNAEDGADRFKVSTNIIGYGPLLWTPEGDLLAAVRDEIALEPGIYRISTEDGFAYRLTPAAAPRLMGLRMNPTP